MERPLALLASALFLTIPVSSQAVLAPRALKEIPRAGKEAIAQVGQFRSVQLKGSQLKKAVDRVAKELNWHKHLSNARLEAVKSGKPILWVQMLGDLTGHT